MRFFRLMVALLCAGVSGLAAAADLLQIYRDALVQDSEYAAARASWQAGQEVVVQGRSLLLPNLSGTGSYTFNNRDLQNVPNQQFNATFIGVNLSQPLFRMQNVVQYQQSRTQLTQSEAQFALASQDLILRVVQAYFDVLLAEVNVEVNEAQKRAIAQQLEQAKRNFEVGTATIVDTYEAQARYDLVVSQGIGLQNDLAVKRDALERIIARPAPALVRPSRGIQIDPLKPNNSDAWVQEAYETSLDVRLADAALTLAQQQIELQRAGHYPTLDAVASVGYSDNSLGAISAQGIRGNITTAGIQLAIPIYQGGSDRISGAAGDCDPRKGEAGSRNRAARRCPVDPAGVPRLQQRHRTDRGAPHGRGLDPESGGFHQARAGGRRADRGRRAERSAVALFRPARSRTGHLQYGDQSVSAEGRSRSADRERRGRRQRLDQRQRPAALSAEAKRTLRAALRARREELPAALRAGSQPRHHPNSDRAAGVSAR